MTIEAEVIGSARIAARRREVRRDRARTRRRIAIAIVAATAIGYGAMSLTGTSVFKLERIEVAGATSVSADDVIAASGLHTGASALGLDLDAAAAAVRELAQVADARVERVGNLGVRIVVTERKPVIEVRVGEQPTFIDATGRALDTPAPRTALPVVRVDGPMSGAVLDATSIQTVLSFWRRAGSAVRRSVDELTIVNGSLSFRAGSTTVLVGSLHRLRAKLAAYQAILDRARADERRLTFVDVRTPERATARLA